MPPIRVKARLSRSFDGGITPSGSAPRLSWVWLSRICVCVCVSPFIGIGSREVLLDTTS
ncbi:hypothetical protein BDY19DRAFT_938199 [Irpex rosettiformis]|uniref:Uncharacterized protein n=1 Tax=Irpex rosettiformis TaxID=378272 RepID=A0ACB8U761_9APHY|nr:hypothetical protein BDY19DRAFT_938199 [Irpex rosettiformis]